MKCEYCKENFDKGELTQFVINELGCNDCIKELYGDYINE